MRKAAGKYLSAALGATLLACSSSEDRAPEREPRSAPEEGFVLRAREPLPPGLPPLPTPRPLRRRPKAGAQAIFGKRAAEILMPQLEGVWSISAIEVPILVSAFANLSGYALISGDRLQFFALLEGRDVGIEKRYTLFQAGSYSLAADLSGQIAMISEGGFTNLTPRLSRLPAGEVAEELPGFPGRPAQRDPEEVERVYNTADLRHVRFFGTDHVRIERDPAHYVELQRIPTNRVLSERYGARARSLRITRDPPPLAEQPPDRIDRERFTPPTVIEHRRLKREVLGAWRVLEVRNSLRDPSQTKAQGTLVFLDGYAVYQMSFSRSGFLGRQETLFQTGARRYAVTAQGEMIIEELFGVTNLRQQNMTRIQPGSRRSMQIEFESEQRLILRRGREEYLVLERTNRPRFVEEELEREKLEEQGQ